MTLHDNEKAQCDGMLKYIEGRSYPVLDLKLLTNGQCTYLGTQIKNGIGVICKDRSQHHAFNAGWSMNETNARRKTAEISRNPCAAIPVHCNCRSITVQVEVGDNAAMTIPDPRAYAEGGASWILRYGNVVSYRYALASVVDSYGYLLNSQITQKEAIRRLKLLRAEHKSLMLGDKG